MKGEPYSRTANSERRKSLRIAKLAEDVLVAFEGRQYSVPFAHLGRTAEVRGGAGRVQVIVDRCIVADHPRHTAERLLSLGMPYAAEPLELLLSDSVKHSTAPHAFLEQMLEVEYQAREARRTRTALRLSNLPPGQTLADFDFAFQPAIERSRIETLATCAFIRAAETALIQGPPGVGKSHLAVGLGVKAIEHGFSVQFYRFDELKIALKTDAHLPPARLRRRKYLSTSPLIVDELGFEPMSREEASLFFRLVACRHSRGSILITTNNSVREWTDLLAGDEALTTVILDRLLHKAHVLNIKGRSYRFRDLDQTLGTVRS